MIRRVAAGIAVGAGVWSLTEYAVHRWAMHGRKGQNSWSEEHLDHHAKPYRTFELKFDRELWMKVLGVPVVGLPTAAVAGATAGRGAALPAGVAAGLAFSSCYAGYTHSHHIIHHEPPRTRLGHHVRKHHLAHHFATPRRNYGVTAAAGLWDVVLRSGRTPERVKVPRRIAPPWLVDDTGELLPAYAADYELAGRTRRPVEDADLGRAMADRAPVLD